MSIVIFFIIVCGLGSMTTKRFSAIEKLMVGLAAIPVIGIVFNTLHIPLDWRIFLSLAAVGIAREVINRKKKSLKESLKNNYGTLIALTFLMILAGMIYINGSFHYSWLEDDDPWTHAAGVKYVALEKNARVPSGEFHYINPYPPGYDILLGVLHQISPSLNWTIKFFNGLIICLGFLFFYMFIKEFTGRREVAFLATFLLIMTPCYLSHFIWAHALVVPLFFAAFYFILKSLKEDGHIFATGICLAAIPLVQPTQTIKFSIMLAIMLLMSALCQIPKESRRFKNVFFALLIAAGLALIWWGPVIADSLLNTSQLAVRADTDMTHTVATDEALTDIFSPTGGTATEVYTWKSFWDLPKPNYINNPTGFGPFLSILILFGFIISLIQILRRSLPSRERFIHLTLLLWLSFTFLGTNSATFNLPIGLFAFRFWMLLSIQAVILAAEALHTFDVLLQKYFPPARSAFLLGILCCVALQSGFYKYGINSCFWSPGTYFSTRKEIDGYVWLKENLAPNTKVFAFADNLLVIGMDMRADVWDKNYKADLHNAFYKPLRAFHENLKKHQFEFLIIRRRDGLTFGREEVNKKLIALDNHPQFERIFSNGESFIFAVLR